MISAKLVLLSLCFERFKSFYCSCLRYFYLQNVKRQILNNVNNRTLYSFVSVSGNKAV